MKKLNAVMRRHKKVILIALFLIVFLYNFLPRCYYSQTRAQFLLGLHSSSMNTIAEYMIESSTKDRYYDEPKGILDEDSYKNDETMPFRVKLAMWEYFSVVARACPLPSVEIYRAEDADSDLPEGSAIVTFLIYHGDGQIDIETGNPFQRYQYLVYQHNINDPDSTQLSGNWCFWG